MGLAWLRSKLFGPIKSRDEDLAEKLYQVMVLGGGPSSESETHIGAINLEIPFAKLEKFAQKRVMSLEALLFVAAQIETLERSQKMESLFGGASLHPFAIEMGKQIGKSWRERGVEISDFDVAEMCFSEVEGFLEKPFKWGRKWLDEFYEDPEQSGEHYIMWTDQWLKEFETMRKMVADHS